MTGNPLGHWNQWFFCVGGFLSDLKCEKNFGGLDNYQYQLRLKIPERCSASSTTRGSGRANPQRLPKLWKKKLLICQWTHWHQIPMEQTCIQGANFHIFDVWLGLSCVLWSSCLVFHLVQVEERWKPKICISVTYIKPYYTCYTTVFLVNSSTNQSRWKKQTQEHA